MYRVKFRTDRSGMIEELEAAIESVRSIELDNAFFVEDGVWIESYTFSATSKPDLEAIADRISGMALLDSREVPTGPSTTSISRVLVTAREPYPFILGVVLRQGAIPNRIVLQNQECDVLVTVQNWESIRALADEVTETFGKFDLNSVKEIEYTGEPLDSGKLSDVVVAKLTDEQLEILETAFTRGFFAVPRESSAEELAAELDIATSTLSERLRTAQQNLLELIYGPVDRTERTDEDD